MAQHTPNAFNYFQQEVEKYRSITAVRQVNQSPSAKPLDHLKCACTCSREGNFIYFLIDFLSAAIPLLVLGIHFGCNFVESVQISKQLQVLPLNLVTLLTHCLVYICLRLGKSKAGQEHKNKAGKKLHPNVSALGSPIFYSSGERKLGVALESLQGLRDLT